MTSGIRLVRGFECTPCDCVEPGVGATTIHPLHRSDALQEVAIPVVMNAASWAVWMVQLVVSVASEVVAAMVGSSRLWEKPPSKPVLQRKVGHFNFILFTTTRLAVPQAISRQAMIVIWSPVNYHIACPLHSSGNSAVGKVVLKP